MKVFIRTRQEADVPAVTALHVRTQPFTSDVDSHVVIADLPGADIAQLREQEQFEVFDDIQFRPGHLPPLLVSEPHPTWWEREFDRVEPMIPAPWRQKSQADVMEHIRAPEAQASTRGEGVTIAIVDTGTDGSRADFPNRSPLSYSPSFTSAWEDDVGHGTMCAAIACGRRNGEARYDGVAPGSTLLSARSTLKASDLYLLYQHFLREKRNGSFPGGLVVSNSYGLYTCEAPSYPVGHPYVDLIRECVAEGIVFVFAAGNNHAGGVCRHPENDCDPNTIWAVNSIDEVITVGTVNWDETNHTGEHANSSRGPGQWSVRQDKPDVVAPTYGDVAWGGDYRPMEWWGTSGACPQVAGLAALLLAQDVTLTPTQIREQICSTARTIPGVGRACVGAGIIDCYAAV